MQVVKRTLFVLVVAWCALIIFAPKREIYYLLEQRIKPLGFMVYDETLSEYPLGLTLRHAKLLYRGIPVGVVEDADFMTLLFYTRFNIYGFQLSSSLQKIIHANPTIRQATLEHRFWTPKKIFFRAQGSFGKLQGWVDFDKHKIHLRLIEEGRLDGLKKYLKKDKKGWYYEQGF